MADAEGTHAIEFDRSVIGVEVDAGSHLVTEEEIVAYARSLGETNPLYVDPEQARAGPFGCIVAPPCFYTFFRFATGPDPKVQFGNISFVARQEIKYFEQIRAGDTISAKAQIADVYSKTGRTGTMVFVVHRSTFRNQHGRTVMVVDSSNVLREVSE